MIPDLPPSVTDGERLHFYSTLWGNLSDQSSIHVNWHTHRQNPSTCWICDMYILTQKVLDISEKYITKSPLDKGTRLSSDEESDTEIENDSSLNYNEEDISNEPEFDIEDGQDSSSEERV